MFLTAGILQHLLQAHLQDTDALGFQKFLQSLHDSRLAHHCA